MGPFHPKAVANFFLERAQLEGSGLSPMKLQKLVYFSHGWHLGLFDVPLIDEPIQAWVWGPVIQSLYHEFKRFGSGAITDLATSVEWDPIDDNFKIITPTIPANDQEEREFVLGMWGIYGKYAATRLSNATHAVGTPWYQMWLQYKNDRGAIPKGIIIPNNTIREYFAKLASEKSS